MSYSSNYMSDPNHIPTSAEARDAKLEELRNELAIVTSKTTTTNIEQANQRQQTINNLQLAIEDLEGMTF